MCRPRHSVCLLRCLAAFFTSVWRGLPFSKAMLLGAGGFLHFTGETGLGTGRCRVAELFPV